jgi:nicotinamide riboside kinase
MTTDPRLRLGLLGGECTGKSAFAARISAETGAHVVGEYLRTFVETSGRPPTREEQVAMLDAQRAMDRHECPSPIHVADPAPGMTAVYSLVYFDDASLMEQALADARTFDLLVWCDTDIPWVPDGAQRDGPEFRDAAHAVLTERLVPLLREEGIPVLRVSGGIDERWAAIRERLTEAWHP